MNTPTYEREKNTPGDMSPRFHPAPLGWLFDRLVERLFARQAPQPPEEPFEEHMNGLA